MNDVYASRRRARGAPGAVDKARASRYRGEMLGLRPLPRTLEACLRDIASARMEARAEASEELGRHLAGEVDETIRARAVAALEKALSDTHPAVRSRAATALADARAVAALPKLLVAVEDDDAFVRQMALSALGELGDRRAATKLERALSDTRPEVRYQAVIAIVRVAPEEARRAISRALDDDDPAVRHIALRLAEDDIEGGREPFAGHLEAATRLLTDDHADVAVAAAILLARALREKLPAKARALLLAVARGDLRGKVGTEEEQGALEACGEAALREAIPALETRAYGLMRLVRQTSEAHAKSALAALGHARATSELLAELGASSPEARARAIVAAGRARLEAARDRLARLADDPATRDLAEEALSRLATRTRPEGLPEGEG
jgi:HEAT repeat protein